MLTFHALQKTLAPITYKNWEIRAEAMGTGFYLQVLFKTAAGVKGWEKEVVTEQHGRKWFISHFATKSEVVQTALMAVLAAEEHEARENFKYNGRAIFGPHFDVDRLAELCNDPDAQDFRAEGITRRAE